MMNDLANINACLDELRLRGWWTRAAQEDGWKAVPVDVIRRASPVLFWHKNETGAFEHDGTLARVLHFQHFHRDAAEVKAALEAYGLHAVIEALGRENEPKTQWRPTVNVLPR